jgi:hypothetical protein
VALFKSRGKVAPSDRFSDCAVAVALPMAHAEFEQDVDGSAVDYDFVREFLRGFSQDYPGQSTQFAWNAGYSQHVQALSHALAFAKGLGVGVVVGATLADFRRLLTTHQTITLFGHFRGWDVRPEEITDTSALVDAFRTAPDSAWRRLRAEMEKLTPSAMGGLGAGDPSLMAATLSEVMESQPLFDEAPACAERMRYPTAYWPWKNRQALAAVLPSLAKPRVYEFRNGLVRLDEIIDAIPDSFAGTIDFIVCNSIFIAEAAQQRPRCRIIASYGVQNLGRRALIYEAILKTMQQQDLKYLDAAEQLHAAWIEHERGDHV